jgi:hypothetical protein
MTQILKPKVENLTRFYHAFAVQCAKFAKFIELLKPFLHYPEAKQVCDLVHCLATPAVFREWDQVEVVNFHILVGMNITNVFGGT